MSEIPVDGESVEVTVESGQWRETRAVPLGHPHRAVLTLHQGDSIYTFELEDSSLEPLSVDIEITSVDVAKFGRGAEEWPVVPHRVVDIHMSGKLHAGTARHAPQA